MASLWDKIKAGAGKALAMAKTIVQSPVIASVASMIPGGSMVLGIANKAIGMASGVANVLSPTVKAVANSPALGANTGKAIASIKATASPAITQIASKPVTLASPDVKYDVKTSVAVPSVTAAPSPVMENYKKTTERMAKNG